MSRTVLSDVTRNAAFRDEGFVILDLLPPEGIDALRAAFDAVEQEHRYDFVASVLLPDTAIRARVHAAVAPVMRRYILPALHDYRVVLGNFAVKRAAAPMGAMPLHQDCTFVDETRFTGITIWSPLVDVGPENGMLGLVPGSHRLENTYRDPCPLPHGDAHDIIQTRYLRYLPMRAGQVLLMDNRVVHASKPNLSGSVRPVAAGVAIPNAATLRCCYVEDGPGPAMTSVFDVPDAFYLRHMMRARPSEGTCRMTVAAAIENLTAERMDVLFH